MLTIRREQMQSMQTRRACELETPLLERFVERCPEDWSRLGEHATRALIRETILAGVARRIVSEDALFGLLQLHLELGLGLERAPERAWALAVLDHPTLPGPLKVNLVMQRVHALTQGRRVVSREDV